MTKSGYDEAAPEGGRHRFEEEPSARMEETRTMSLAIFGMSDRCAAKGDQR
jgi:hypothetical protein